MKKNINQTPYLVNVCYLEDTMSWISLVVNKKFALSKYTSTVNIRKESSDMWFTFQVGIYCLVLLNFQLCVKSCYRIFELCTAYSLSPKCLPLSPEHLPSVLWSTAFLLREKMVPRFASRDKTIELHWEKLVINNK